MEHTHPNQTGSMAAEPAPPASKRAGWRSVGAALLFLFAYFAVQFFVTIAYVLITAIGTVLTQGAGSIGELTETVLRTVTARGELLTGVIDLLSLGAFALILIIMRRPLLPSVGLRRTRIAALLPLLPLGAALNVLLTSLISMLPDAVLQGYIEASSEVLLGGYGVLSILILAVLAPVTEETLFRGLVYGNLKTAMPKWLAVAISSVVFGLMHGQILWIAYTAVLGAFFCIVVDRYKTLLAGILLHMSFNAGSFLVQQLQNVPAGVALSVSGAIVAGCVWYVFGSCAARQGAKHSAL